MTCPSERYSGRDEAHVRWENWSGRVTGIAGRFFEPDTLPDLVHIVQQATEQGRRIHVVGSGWSFGDIAFSPEWMVSLDRLKKPLNYVVDGALNAAWKARHAARTDGVLFHVAAGIKLFDLNRELEARGLALPTLGGYNAQALAGVVSTGTHGGNIAVPPFPDLVVAIHLVTVGGREIWLERASEPITEDVPLARALPCPDTEIIRDDALFDSLIVGMGRFGIIYAFVLRVVPLFRLAEWTVRIDRADLTRQLRRGVTDGTLVRPLLDFLPPPPHTLGAQNASAPSGLEVVFDTRNPSGCWVTRRWITDLPDLNVAFEPYEQCQPGGKQELLATFVHWLNFFKFAASDQRLALIGVARNEIELLSQSSDKTATGKMVARFMRFAWDIDNGGAIGGQTREGFDKRYRLSMGEGRRGVSHVIISRPPEASRDENLCFRADSIEFIFDASTDSYVDFLEDIAARAPAVKQAGYIALNWSAASRAKLSMHNLNSDHGVAIEVTSLSGLPDNETWFRTLESLAVVSRGARPHWGQINNLTGALILALYGARFDTWKRSLGALVGGSMIFSNNYTLRRGLEPPPGSQPTLHGPRAGDILAAIQAPVTELLLSSDDTAKHTPIEPIVCMLLA